MMKKASAALIAIPVALVVWFGIVGDANAGSVANKVSHSVKRSDGTTATMKDRHEFRGGSHKYFSALAEKNKHSWLPTMNTFKKGWVRIYLDWPVRVSSIVVRRASVGRKSFKGGEIVVEVQQPKGKWVKILERKDSDIDRAVTISKAVRSAGPVKSVRIRFKTPEPITVGPIDLNG